MKTLKPGTMTTELFLKEAAVMKTCQHCPSVCLSIYLSIYPVGIWEGQKDVAVKTLKPGTMTTELFLKEAAVMKTCQHKHLVTLYAVCSVDEPILIVTELMPNGSLLSYLRDDIGSRLPLQVLFNMSSQVTRRFLYCSFIITTHTHSTPV